MTKHTLQINHNDVEVIEEIMELDILVKIKYDKYYRKFKKVQKLTFFI